MNYIIDGHNLISKIPGLSLEMVDDEEQLALLLNRFAETQRSKPLSNLSARLEVYFDKSPVLQAGRRNWGRVQAYFVAESSTADEAIKRRLARLGKSAPGWTVVTSDHSIQAAARELHSRVLKSEDFAQTLLDALQRSGKDEPTTGDKLLSASEVDEWLSVFKQRKSTK